MSVMARTALVCCVVVLLALSACVQAPATTRPLPTQNVPPTAEPAALPPMPAPAAGAATNDWARIKAAGTMLFASSLDNAPFDMYNAQFQPDGFDIALATELGKRLGIRARFKDYAFDGLLNALQTNQVDAVISAMAITKDRQQVADFTRDYYRGDDAVLAAPDSQITAIKTQADLASRRVGVQSGSVYETFLQKNLVQTGQMPEANLRSYRDISDAFNDLQTGGIDLVILDRLPADTYVSGGQARLVGQSMYVQDYGIAVRRGSTLAPELNQALAEVQADGTLDKLAEKFLGVPAEQVLPAPTPSPTAAVPPTAAPTPTPAPIDDMAYVADLTLDDHNGANPPLVQPGQPLQKGWRIKNTGTTTWSPDYKLDFARGEKMGGQPVLMGQPVAPGATKDVYVNLVAPQEPGTHTGYWQMKNAAGKAFGQTIYVQVAVAGPPTPVPPTAAPVTNIYFTVDRPQPVTINAGDCVNFSWSVSNVNAVYFCTNGSCKPEQGQGTEHVCPSSTTTYELRVQMRDNTTQSQYITVNVQGSSLPTIQYFGANPTSIQQGQCTTLSWNVQGQTSRVALVRNGYPLEDGNRANGSKDDCQAPAGTQTYELQAWGPNNSGPIKQQTQVQVQQNQPPPCQPQTHSVSDGNCGQTQTMQICDTLVVTLQANSGTGYSWVATAYGDPMLSFQGGGDPQCGGAPGAPCSYRWQFHGASSGSTTVQFVLRGPSGDESQQCSFPVRVQ
jgi:ABC-type amino acid transport substrate-binding protein/predicted secreted protein